MSEKERLIKALTACSISRTEQESFDCDTCPYSSSEDTTLACRALLQDVLKFLYSLNETQK